MFHVIHRVLAHAIILCYLMVFDNENGEEIQFSTNIIEKKYLKHLYLLYLKNKRGTSRTILIAVIKSPFVSLTVRVSS